MNKIKLILVGITLMSVTGCFTKAVPVPGPGGVSALSISCSEIVECYKKAQKECEKDGWDSYEILRRGKATVSTQEILVECIRIDK
ncbi:MAG: hypothetical protein GKS04_02650 [Candidatus Mycalebacterium zealandia]|nr:MAG: hypothetical protein GKS04_02650 [Candidatus Mycalebacterium zealandia]